MDYLKPKKGKTTIGQKIFEWGKRTYVMGVINVTPDSFSGDGLSTDVDRAVQMALDFQSWGADIVDVGGESTRPPLIYSGAGPVSAVEEISRVIPTIEAIAETIKIPISIDTYKASVAEEAIKAGASMINDVWALSGDPRMGQVAAEKGTPIVLMHNQQGTNYIDLVPDVIHALFGTVRMAKVAGILPENTILDPGIGFGKTAAQNLEILRRLDEFDSLQRPLLLGISRKSTIGYVLDLPVHDRLEGTAASITLSITGGADIVRVHDVKEMVRVARMTDAIVRGWNPNK